MNSCLQCSASSENRGFVVAFMQGGKDVPRALQRGSQEAHNGLIQRLEPMVSSNSISIFLLKILIMGMTWQNTYE